MPSIAIALDQGTTSSRAIAFNMNGERLGFAQRELTQHFPQPGWVEHDANEIWQSQRAVTAQVFEQLAAQGTPPSDIVLGITNQRETIVLWDRSTGQPLHHALVWQDRRTALECERLRSDGNATLIRNKTGLFIDAYFSATKIKWLLDNIPGARIRAAKGELACGTIDSWLIWNLSGGKTHVTDASNASRTMLFNIHSGNWDEGLLNLFSIPHEILPSVVSSQGEAAITSCVGLPQGVAITGIAGDQQAALFGQACLSPGMAKNTYGTGCFLLMNIGTANPNEMNDSGLLTTVAWQRKEEPHSNPSKLTHALEGSVFIAGAAVQWLRDGLGIIEKASDIEALAASVDDSDDVYFVPALTGLGAPYWDSSARGTLVGITRGTNRAHIARATLNAIAFQTAELLIAMTHASGVKLDQLRVDGGAASNNLLLQIQADILQTPVVRPSELETTALGAAYLALLGVGAIASAATFASRWQIGKVFEPSKPKTWATERLERWQHAVKCSRGWVR